MANAKRCFSHCHMTPEEYGLWYYCRCVSKNSSTVYLSGREIAKEFDGISKNVIYRIADSLTAKGWFRDLAPYHRNAKTGALVPRTVYPLAHEEWVEQYSDIECHPIFVSPVPKSGQDDSVPVPVPIPPVPKSGRSCPDSGTDLSRNQEQRIKEVESKDKRERGKNSKSDIAPALYSCTENEQDLGQVKAAVQEVQQWMLGLDPPLKFMPASKDKEIESTKTTITKRLSEGVSTQDIKVAIGRVPLDNDGNPSFAIRDNLDAAINQVLNDREAAAAQVKLLRKVEANERAKVVAELAEIAERQRQEEALVEDSLGV